MNVMKISYIIPAFNEEKLIEKCIRSIVSQGNMPEHEIIVVDNNSKDRTVEIIKKEFPKVLVIKETRQGMTLARNTGAKKAQGDILVFFDADVIVPSHWTERMLSKFIENKNLVGVSGPYSFYDLPMFYKPFAAFVFQILNRLAETVLNRLLKKASLWVGGNIAVKKDVFWKIGGFNEDIVFYGEDIDLPTKLMKYGTVRFLYDMWVWSSARRLVDGNPITEGVVYIINYAWFFITGRSRGKSYKEVR